MYQEISQIDQITVLLDGTVLIRNRTVVMKNGIEISTSYNRRTFVPGSDVTECPENVQNICNAAWTPEVVSSYREKLATLQ